MADSATVMSFQALHDGLRSELFGTYKQVNESHPNVKKVTMYTDAKGRVDLWYFRLGRPKPGYMGPNDPFPRGYIKERLHKTITRDFGLDISWKKADRRDDKTQSLYEYVRDIGDMYANLMDEIKVQIQEGSTNYRLLPVIPKCPDGAALHSATTGSGADRFLLSGGNLMSGAGTSAANIRADFFKAKNTRFAKWKMPNGIDFIYGESQLQNWMIEYPPELDDEMQESFKQKIVLDTAGVSNIMIDSNNVPTLWMNPRLTDPNDYYIYNLDSKVPPYLHALREGLDTQEYNAKNSDKGRFNRLEGILTLYCVQVGCLEPYGVLKVTNT